MRLNTWWLFSIGQRLLLPQLCLSSRYFVITILPNGSLLFFLVHLFSTIVVRVSNFASFLSPTFFRTNVTDRLMSPAVRGSQIMASPMRMRTAGADSAMGNEATIIVSTDKTY